MKEKRWAVLLLVSLLLISNRFPVSAQDRRQSDFESITDSYMQTVMSEHHVVGASVSVVQNGEVLFQKGYGYADLDNSIPVDAETTAFQIASVTKLFTVTAVMQMVEQGKLDLDEDINKYLSVFQVQNPYDTPVTLRTLLTHTSGIDDRMPLYLQSGGGVLFDDLEELESTLRRDLPPVVREPGTFCQYNVMGMALAGYLVEVASGLPFDQYVTDKILTPLGMNNSSYGLIQPILATATKSYQFTKGEYIQGGYTLNGNHPSGAMFASSADMAKFIMAHLEAERSILSAESLEQMHAHQYPADDRLTGYGLGFYETIRNGYRTIEHGGYLPRFSSKLTMLPEQGIGMFVVLNTDSPTSGSICNDYVDLFYDYFTDGVEGQVAPSAFDMNADEISGVYSLDGFGLTDTTKIKAQLITCKISCDDNGNLQFQGEGLIWDFYYIGEGMFYSPDSGNYCRVSDANGEWVLNILGADHVKTNTTERGLFLFFLVSQPVAALAILIQIVAMLRKKNTILGSVSAISGILDLLILSAFVSMPILYTAGNTRPLLTVVQPAMPFIAWIYLLSVLGILLLTIRAWKDGGHSKLSSSFYTAYCFLSILSILFLVKINALHF